MSEPNPSLMATTIQTSLAPPITRLTAVDNVLQFNPAAHLVGELPNKTISMKEIGFAEDIGVSPVAVSHPFRLFTQEAVEIMRKEIFNVPDKYKFQSNIAKSQLRGYAQEYVDIPTHCIVLLT